MDESDQPSYEVVAALGADAQRRLLDSGVAVERLWAAWALGMRAGAAALPELTTAVAAAPEPGLRAHLVIVLAGLGERRLVETLALHDPEPLVRATAGQHLLRTAPADASLADDAAVGRLLRDPSGDVRLAVLRELLRALAARGGPPLSLGDLERLAHDAALPVRRLALETIVSRSIDVAARRVLAGRLAVEPDPALRGWLAARVIAAGGARAVFGLVVGDGSERDTDLLRALEADGQRFGWDEIATLAGLEEPGLDAHLLALLASADYPALRWLLGCAIRAEQRLRSPDWAAEALLDPLLPRLHSERLTPGEQAQCRLLVEYTERRLLDAAWRICDYYGEELDEHGECHDPLVLAELAALRAGEWYRQQLQRMQELRRLAGDGERAP